VAAVAPPSNADVTVTNGFLESFMTFYKWRQSLTLRREKDRERKREREKERERERKRGERERREREREEIEREKKVCGMGYDAERYKQG
jgi:hypothetical protein